MPYQCTGTDYTCVDVPGFQPLCSYSIAELELYLEDADTNSGTIYAYTVTLINDFSQINFLIYGPGPYTLVASAQAVISSSGWYNIYRSDNSQICGRVLISGVGSIGYTQRKAQIGLNYVSPTTTTTPTTTTPTTTTPTTTTPTTTTPTTTTTTTLAYPLARIASLKQVKTIYLTNGTENIGTDSSDNKGTLKTIESDSLSFGPLAPGETSPTMIIYLNVPSAIVISNVKIALIDCGGFNFSDTNFGVEIKSFIDYNIVPSSEFAGINVIKDYNSIYNITVGARDLQNSNYVYLNVVVPRGQLFGSGVVRYFWMFDYA